MVGNPDGRPDTDAPSNLIDMMARAMFEQDHDEPWEDGERLTLDIYLNNARAALRAAREPTERMIAARDGHNAPQDRSTYTMGYWQAMIDSELEEGNG